MPGSAPVDLEATRPMKAARIHRYGGPEVLVVEDVPVPEPAPGEVLVAVHASSVNPVDTKIRRGYQRAVVRRRLPTVLGMDLSGVVEAVGPGVEGFAPGDEVFASPNHRGDGTYAEYARVKVAELAPKPANLTHEEAASLPLVALTAWQCLDGRAQPGDRVLIQAGSGGVGTAAIQLAKHLGATVTTTCSGRNADLVRELGADSVVDYTQERFWEVLEPQDLALDALGGAERRRLRQVLRRGGRLVSVNSDLPALARRVGPYLGVVAAALKLAAAILWSRLSRNVRLTPVVRSPDGQALAHLARLTESGALRPIIDRVYPLEEIAEAHRYSESGRARGKIVIRIRE